MIFKANRDITGVYKGTAAFSVIYKGAVMVWEAIRSCFGKGYWINRYGWSNQDRWRNNA